MQVLRPTFDTFRRPRVFFKPSLLLHIVYRASLSNPRLGPAPCPVLRSHCPRRPAVSTGPSSPATSEAGPRGGGQWTACTAQTRNALPSTRSTSWPQKPPVQPAGRRAALLARCWLLFRAAVALCHPTAILVYVDAWYALHANDLDTSSAAPTATNISESCSARRPRHSAP